MCLYPKFYLNDIYQITPDFLKMNGLDALILDVDNTLISNTVNDADEKVKSWILEMQNNGIALCIVSNGSGKRVERFNCPFGIPTVSHATKPFPKGYRKAKVILKDRRTAAVGDQLFTDVLGGNSAGFPVILVKPIDSFEEPFIRFKRVLERPFMKQIEKGKRQK